MFKKIINWFWPKPEFISVTLKEIPRGPIKEDLSALELPTIGAEPNPNNKKTVLVDRNYHHYVITEHTQQRMQERKISYFEINLAFQYGNLVDDKSKYEDTKCLELNVSDLPKKVLDSLDNNQIKAITRICPITLIINMKDKIIITVYPNNKTNFKEKVISDYVRKGRNNKYTRKIKGKLIAEEKKQRKLAKKLRPYKEIDE